MASRGSRHIPLFESSVWPLKKHIFVIFLRAHKNRLAGKELAHVSGSYFAFSLRSRVSDFIKDMPHFVELRSRRMHRPESSHVLLAGKWKTTWAACASRMSVIIEEELTWEPPAFLASWFSHSIAFYNLSMLLLLYLQDTSLPFVFFFWETTPLLCTPILTFVDGQMGSWGGQRGLQS